MCVFAAIFSVNMNINAAEVQKIFEMQLRQNEIEFRLRQNSSPDGERCFAFQKQYSIGKLASTIFITDMEKLFAIYSLKCYNLIQF